MILAIFAFAGAMMAISFGNSPFFLCASFFLVGLFMGIMKVVLNLEAENFSRTFNRCIMARSHSFGSLGLFITTIFGALFVYWHVSFFYHFMITGVISVIAVVVVFQRYSLLSSKDSAQAGKGFFVKPTRAIMLLFGVCMSSVLVEMTVIDWSVIFMRDIFDMPPFINILSFSMMALCQFFIRYYSHHFVDLLGVMGSIITSLFVLSLGVLIVVISNSWAVAIIGCGLVGIGSSVIFPMVMVLASQLKERAAVLSLISLNQVIFTSVLCAPAILGMIAENIGIRYIFSLSFPFLAVSFWCFFIFNFNKRYRPT